MLWQLKNLHMGLMAHCGSPDCSHCTELDIDSLIEKFGPEHVFVNDPWIAAHQMLPLRHQGGTITIKSDTRALYERTSGVGYHSSISLANSGQLFGIALSRRKGC